MNDRPQAGEGSGSAAAGPSLYLALDQGTHASRAVILDGEGEIVASAEREIALHRPAPDHVEQDGDELVASLQESMAEVLSAIGDRGKDVTAAGLASQRASCVCWDAKSGQPLSPVFSWQDRRAHPWLRQFEAHGEWVHRTTGLFLSAHYGASKLRWALDHLPAVRLALERGHLRWGPQASFLVQRLVEGHASLADPQCAARTQLWSLDTGDWDPRLLELFGIPAGGLPACVPTLYRFGTMPAGSYRIPLVAVNGDQSAAVFAFGWPDEDAAYMNIGTSAFVQRVVSRPPGDVPRQLTGVVFDDGASRLYTVEGNVNGAGAGLEWLRDSLGIRDAVERLPAWLEQGGTIPLFLNGIAGLGGPYWKPDFASRFVGEGDERTKAVAVVESIAFLLQANIDEMDGYLRPAGRIRVSGGVSRLDGLCRRIASLSRMPVLRRDDPEATARGIGFLAAGCPPRWNVRAQECHFEPAEDDALRERYARWKALMAEATRGD